MLLLFGGRVRADFDLPLGGLVGTESNFEPLEFIAAGDEEGELVAGLVVREVGGELVGADAEVPDSEDFVIHIQAGAVGGAFGGDAGDDEATGVVLRFSAQGCGNGRSGTGAEAETVPVERFGVIEILRGFDSAVEEFTERGSGDFFGGGLELLGRVAFVLGVAGVGETHDIVERFPAAGGLANFGVEQESHDGPLAVVADAGVAGIFVGAVVADPGVEGRLFGGLEFSAGGGLDVVDEAGEGSGNTGCSCPAPSATASGGSAPEIVGTGGEARAKGGERGVVVSEAFGNPERFGVVFVFVVEGAELYGAEALDVPGVEVLV